MAMVAMLEDDTCRLSDFHCELGGDHAIGAASDAVGSEMFAAHALNRSPSRTLPNVIHVFFYTVEMKETTRLSAWNVANAMRIVIYWNNMRRAIRNRLQNHPEGPLCLLVTILRKSKCLACISTSVAIQSARGGRAVERELRRKFPLHQGSAALGLEISRGNLILAELRVYTSIISPAL